MAAPLPGQHVYGGMQRHNHPPFQPVVWLPRKEEATHGNLSLFLLETGPLFYCPLLPRHLLKNRSFPLT